MRALTPDIIDAAVLQLRTLMQVSENIPVNVKESGEKFVNDLDAWSEQMKASVK